MARRYPGAQIVAVSNSAAQRAAIERDLQRLGSTNVKVITADMNDFDIEEKFDRVVSVEMFEHMSNWQRLLGRARQWLADDGRAFLHVFAHRTTPYAFDVTDKSDWIAQHFFTGAISPISLTSKPNGVGVASTMRARPSIGSRTSTRTGIAFDRYSNPSMARSWIYGCGAGACSFWRRPGSSVTTMARPGASATTGCVQPDPSFARQ
jgi:SAM-dependent methyltransferase